MSTFVVVGAGMTGLGAALALGRRGHHVILCERDNAPAPADVEQRWAAWPRPGTPQARLGHIFTPRYCREMRQHAPDVLHRACAAGARPGKMTGEIPGGTWLPEDDELESLFCRRPVMEGVVRQAVEAEPGIEIRVGSGVAGLLTEPADPEGLPRVVGVRTRDGAEWRADAVVIAGGRTLPLATWLGAIGAAAPEEIVDDCGLIYYCRYFRTLATVDNPEARAPSLIVRDLRYLAAVAAPGDNGTFYVIAAPGSWDGELRALHQEEAFMATIRSIPALAPLISPEAAAPIGPVDAMGGLTNRLRRFVAGGRPLALGLFVIGDARCHTNPSVGWGASLGMFQAFRLAEILTARPGDPLARARAFEEQVADELAGWHGLIVEWDRARTHLWQGGQESPPPARPEDDFEAFVRTVVVPATQEDPAVFRAFHRRHALLDPPDALAANTEVLERAAALAAQREPPAEQPSPPGPTREELLAIMAGAALDTIPA